MTTTTKPGHLTLFCSFSEILQRQFQATAVTKNGPSEFQDQKFLLKNYQQQQKKGS